MWFTGTVLLVMWFTGTVTGVDNGTRQGLFLFELCTSMYSCPGNTVELAQVGCTKYH